MLTVVMICVLYALMAATVYSIVLAVDVHKTEKLRRRYLSMQIMQKYGVKVEEDDSAWEDSDDGGDFIEGIECGDTYDGSGDVSDISGDEAVSGEMVLVGSYAWAVSQLEEGLKVRREAWDEPHVSEDTGEKVMLYYVYRENGVDTVSYMRKTPAGAAFGYKSWTGFACDVAANDWVLA